jgi:molecular chaperone GrpE
MPWDDPREDAREEEPLPTQQPDAGEPSGEEEPDNEREIEEATERPTDGGGEDPAAALARERDQYLALAQRTQADFENYRKRAARESAEAGRRAKANLVRDLLPVLDNLERALASAGESEQHLAEGVRMVQQELVGLLEREGIEAFDPRGEPFDPTLHEALSTRAEDGATQGTVLDVVEKGYRLNGTVLRPARVVVAG